MGSTTSSGLGPWRVSSVTFSASITKFETKLLTGELRNGVTLDRNRLDTKGIKVI